MNTISSQPNPRERADGFVARLIEQYAQHEAATARLAQSEARLVVELTRITQTERISLGDVVRNAKRYPALVALQDEQVALKKEIQDISDRMTFADPLVWVGYKYQAYANTPKAINTMVDFRAHCAPAGYICTKRYMFVNAQMRERFGYDLNHEEKFPSDMLLADLYQRDELWVLASDPGFMEQWGNYEYHTEGGKVAKWQNYHHGG